MISHITTQALGQQPTSKIQIVQCDRCNKTSSAEMLGEQAFEKAAAQDPWLREYRTIQTGDGRIIGLCGDICTIEAVKEGLFNMPEPKKVDTNASLAHIKALAKQKEDQQRAESALRNGGSNITVTD